MAVALTISENDRYIGLRNTKALGYFSLGHGAFQSPDLDNLFGAQKLFEKSNATDINGVLPVHSVAHPFEVSRSGIALDPIDMVDHREIGWVWNECERDQPMNVDGLASSVSKQVYVGVSELVDAGSEHLSVNAPGFESVANSIKASHASQITDFVEGPEVGDRNRSPFFDGGGIHVMGRPSGSIGVAVKSPSRAATFGGFAIMAAHFDTYNGRPICLSH